MSYQSEKRQVLAYQNALDNASKDELDHALGKFLSPDYRFRGVHPYNELTSAQAVVDQVWRPLRDAFSPLQRRQDIFLAGTNADGSCWVAGMGHLMGLFDHAWLGIPPTGKQVFVRYAEFHRLKDGLIAETGFFIDVIGVMIQAGLQPLPVETGAHYLIPGPRTHDGLLLDDASPAESALTLALVNQMVDDLVDSYGTRVAPELLARTWHSDMIWYGPAGIGSSYTIDRYQRQHQWPFREGFSNIQFNGHVCRFAEGDYAAWFGWPNLSMTPSGGFLGLPASDRETHMRVVDIYRREGDRLAENWVFIDLPYWLLQQGIDVLARTTTIGEP